MFTDGEGWGDRVTDILDRIIYIYIFVFIHASIRSLTYIAGSWARSSTFTIGSLGFRLARL